MRDAGLDTTVARRWPARYEGEMLIADLNTEGVVVVSNSERARNVDVQQELFEAGE